MAFVDDKKATVWTIAGLDPTGLAGILVDCSVINSFGLKSCAITTLLSAQNCSSPDLIQYTKPNIIQTQLDLLYKNYPPSVIKIGALGSLAIVKIVYLFIATHQCRVVYDPVLIASNGFLLTQINANNFILNSLIRYVDLFTPNILEAEALLNIKISTAEDVKKAAVLFLENGVGRILIKGGHLANSVCHDYYTDGHKCFWINAARLSTKNSRGTGCFLSSAIAASVASGDNWCEAIARARLLLQMRLGLKSQNDMPWISEIPLAKRHEKFQSIGLLPLGFYPIVDSVKWVKRLLDCGVKTLQLRLKDLPDKVLQKIINECVKLANAYQSRLIINDYWQYAIKYNAFGVHLGQEDLLTADIDAIHKAGLRLGISTHCYYEIAKAHRYEPSYLAYGPIYPTTSKKMIFSPRGIASLKAWRELLTYSLVAIGGINLVNLDDILSTGVESISVVSAVNNTDTLEEDVKKFLSHIGEYYANNKRKTALPTTNRSS